MYDAAFHSHIVCCGVVLMLKGIYFASEEDHRSTDYYFVASIACKKYFFAAIELRNKVIFHLSMIHYKPGALKGVFEVA